MTNINSVANADGHNNNTNNHNHHHHHHHFHFHPPPFIPSTRFTLALLVCFAFIIQYSQRGNLPMGITCMANQTKAVNGSVARSINTSMTDKKGIFNEKIFNWKQSEQQFVLGAYWAGYVFTQLPGGWLATSIGAKWVYATSLGTSSFATLCLLLMYWMSSTHTFLIIVLRFIIGLAHGVLFPATIALWSVWAVPRERSTLASIGFCGTHLGTSLTMLSGGLLCHYLHAGWMYLFFFTSFLGFVWLILWIISTADSPHHHKKITDHERDYISNYTGHSGKKHPISFSSIPWKNIFQSKPLLALLFTHNANLFGLFFFLTNLGKILTEVIGFSAKNAGYLLASGYMLTLLTSLLSGIIVDLAVNAKHVTLTKARKISNSLTSFIPVLCMIILCFCDKSHPYWGGFAVILFLAGSGLGYGSGYLVNFADIVPAFSGIIFGITNTSASILGLLGNLIAGIVVKSSGLDEWRKLYIMFGLVYFAGGIVYILYGTAVPRKWAKFKTADADTKQEEKEINSGANEKEKIEIKEEKTEETKETDNKS